VGDNSVILNTADGGVTWTPQNSTVTTHLRDVHFVSETTGWVGGGPWGTESVEGVVLKTTDGGTTWDRQLDGFTANALFFVDADRGLIAARHPGTILATDDGGFTWRFQHCPTTLGVNTASFANQDVGWIVGYEGAILKTVTGGDG
jgi:photosystem II stability/assembly factor-like uncharacterized protein